MVETRASTKKLEGGNGKPQRGESSGTVVAASVDSENFSWAAPSRYGIAGWEEGESPLPNPMNQGDLDACIVAAIKHTIEIQSGKLAKENPQIVVPKISFYYLYHVLKGKPVKDRTIQQMLLWVEKHGAVAEQNYNQETREIAQGMRYYLDWTTVPKSGLNPKHKNFIRDVKHGVLRLGGVIGEFAVCDDYDMEGKRTYFAKSEPIADEEDNRLLLGHATVIMGWGVEVPKEDGECYDEEDWDEEANFESKDDEGDFEVEDDGDYTVEYFEYLNSKGINFGVNGRGKLCTTKVLHWVYQPVLRRWWDNV